MIRYYFAYGSNMWQAQMRTRCPHSRLLGPAALAGYRFIINSRGYANIVAAVEGVVLGLLYTISATDEAALDGFEGVAQGNYRKEAVAVHYDGQTVVALVYIDAIEEEGHPKPEYISRINAAIGDAQLPGAYVASVIRRFVPEAHRSDSCPGAW